RSPSSTARRATRSRAGSAATAAISTSRATARAPRSSTSTSRTAAAERRGARRALLRGRRRPAAHRALVAVEVAEVGVRGEEHAALVVAVGAVPAPRRDLHLDLRDAGGLPI